jgi:predicted protein tyrosine phosphatase
MEIRVCGYVAASLLLEQEPNQWDVLVILDTGINPTDFVAQHTLRHLFLFFDDIEEPRQGKQLVTSHLVKQGLDFAAGKEKVLVTCRAGQSRSAAMAFLIACECMGRQQAIEILDPTRHRPNRRVIEVGGHHEALAYFDEWRVCHSHVRLSDYYDRLEREFAAMEARGARDRITGP